jgi:hypothetical protein
MSENEKVKILTFTTGDGECWGLKKSFIADHRAKEYAGTDPDTTYESEFEYVMGDSFEAIDWMQNNMNPSDYEKEMFQIKKPADISFIQKFEIDESAEISEKEFAQP